MIAKGVSVHAKQGADFIRQSLKYDDSRHVFTLRVEEPGEWPVFEAGNELEIDRMRLPKFGDYVLLAASVKRKIVIARYRECIDYLHHLDMGVNDPVVINMKKEDDLRLIGVISGLRKYF